jgi:YidC/Oxa1 family membrane protein insertase
MRKQTVIAVALICAVWIAYFAYQAKYNQPQNARQKPVEPPKTEQAVRGQEQPVAPPQDFAPVSLNIRNANLNLKEETFSLTTERFDCEFNSKGGVISKMSLKGLTDSEILATAPDSGLKAGGVFDFPVYFNTNDFLYGSEADKSVWNVESKSDTDVTFSLNIVLNEKPVEIKKRYKLNSATYSLDMEYTFVNKSGADIQLPQFIVSPADMVGPKLDYENRYNLLNGVFSVNGEYDYEDKSGSDAIKKYRGSVDWAGISSRYILLIMMPFGQSASEVIMDNRVDYGYRTGMLMPAETIKAASPLTKTFKVYVGPKDKDILVSVDPSLKSAANIMLIIEPIRNFVIWCLVNLNKLFGNMGWSLIVFSLLTKLIFMPLTQKSTESMKKMGLLAPQINAI